LKFGNYPAISSGVNILLVFEDGHLVAIFEVMIGPKLGRNVYGALDTCSHKVRMF
jgi:hypothetical protein